MTLDVLSSVQRTGNDVELPATGGTAWCTVVPPRQLGFAYDMKKCQMNHNYVIM